MIRFSLAVCAAVMALAGLANAQELTIDDYVRKLVAARPNAGEELVGDIMIDRMSNGDQVVYTFDIDAEKTYRVYGACDDDCSDIDLFAADASDQVINWDIVDDAAPILLIEQGDAGGTLTIGVSVEECEADQCVTGVGVYEVATRHQQPDAINNFELAYEEFLQRLSVDGGSDDRPVSDLIVDTMQAGDSRSYDFTIDPRKRYWVWAAGYEECRIDLWAFDASGDI
jgi:hypothetical protein